MIADFVAPIPPSGWLELDGSVISTSTYNALYSVMAMQTTGTRTNASPIVTSIASTANFKAGYYVFGTGISTGTTIVSIDSASQITLSNNASSSGTSSIAVSPWLMNTGTIKLPDLTTSGRYRRSRASSTKVGDLQTDQNKAHTHSSSGTTAVESALHTHSVSGNTGTQSVSHTHSYNQSNATSGGLTGGGSFGLPVNDSVVNTGTESTNHTHAISLNSATESANHTHTFSVTSSSDGGTEVRTLSIVVLTCVKT